MISLVTISQKQQDSNRQSLGRRLRTIVPAKPSPAAAPDKPVQFDVKAIVTVRRKRKEALRETFEKHLDSLFDAVGYNIVLQLVSEKIDPNTKSGKKSEEAVLKGWLQKSAVRAEKVHYTATFTISSDFGQPGAIIVTNQHQKEFLLENIVLEGFIGGPIYFPCNSWVQPKKDNPENRIFFCNKPYLPSQTPEGLKQLRQDRKSVV